MAAATVQPYILRQLKGRNGGTPENIDDKQFQELQNWYAKDGILKRRWGSFRESGIAYAGTLHGAAVYLPSGTDYKVIVGLNNGVGWLDGDEVTILPSSSVNTVPNSAAFLWQLKQYKNSMYCLRDDMEVLLRTDGSSLQDTGIAAPTTALTATEGAAGDLAAGTYEIVYTFYNTRTGAESNPSPAATVTIAANKKINYSAILTTTNSQTNARKVYRSLVGQTDEWFHAFTILDNISSAYTGDNVLLEDMGLPAESTNGVPPGNMEAMEVHQERMWMTDGLLLYYSEVGLPESFAVTSSLNVKSDDGYLIKSMVSFGEILLILKQSGIYFLSGSDEQSFQVRTLHDRHGCVAQHSVAVAEGFAFWFGGDNFYLTDGNRVSGIGTTEVRDLIENIASADYGLMRAEIYPEEGWYICSIPSAGAIVRWLAYNYRSGDWHTMTWHATLGQPQWIKTLPDSNGKPLQYGSFGAAGQNGHLFRHFRPNSVDDHGYAIACSLTTKNYGFQTENHMKFMKDISILISTTTVAESVSLTLFRDDDTVAEDTASFNTYGQKMWKRIPIANPGYPGTFLALQIDYSGDSDFTIAGLAFKIVSLGREAPLYTP